MGASSLPPPPNAALPDESLLIGRPGRPIRALAFSSGAFDTAMQLGVAHALLVIQGRAPDAVVGVSAGAVNAVALAEILQAGGALAPPPTPVPPTPQQLRARRITQLEARVKRFREILDAYQRAPSELEQALLPDTFQIEALRPLEALQLPIHHEEERKARQAAVQARAGLIKLYNHLLELRFHVGTLTRATRRGLGMQASAEIRPSWKRIVARIAEAALGWSLVGSNLPRLAPLVRRLLPPVIKRPGKAPGGATAGELIFRSPAWTNVGRGVADAGGFLLIAVLWLGLSLSVSLPFWGLWALVRWVSGWPGLPWWAFSVVPFAVAAGCAIAAAAGTHDTWPAVRGTLVQLGSFLLLLAGGVVGVGTVLASIMGLVTVVLWRGSGASVSTTLRVAADFAWSATPDVLLAFAVWALIALFLLLWRFPRREYVRRLLARYDLADSLLSENPLRQLIIDILDPTYYGRDRMDDVVERALTDCVSPGTTSIGGRLVGDYARGPAGTRIHVGLGVADVASGRLEVLPDAVRVVDGLLAATATAPAFRPQRIDGKLCIDGANISGRATHLLLDFIRPRLNAKATVVHAYTVAPLPFTRGALEGRSLPYLTLVEVVVRALQLQRFRDASLERRLTELYSDVIPAQAGVQLHSKGGENYLRAWVSPIEPEAPLSVGHDLLAAPDDYARRELIARTVADGCRAALEVMIRPSLGLAPTPPQAPRITRCSLAVKQHLAERTRIGKLQLLVDELPGSVAEGSTAGPGLPEVCQKCVLQAGPSGQRDPSAAQSIRLHPWTTMAPAWPCELESDDQPQEPDSHFTRAPGPYEVRSQEALLAFAEAMESSDCAPEDRWPRTRPVGPGSARPTVSLLFSGGVFRGVYQMGVLSGLSEGGLEPDIIAGASVGSITAALVAESFRQDRGVARDSRIARLAATYLALDRLILTDRFADLVRSFTLRAAATSFSLFEADRFFRRYDAGSPAAFDREARSVVAGIERLLYVSPFELLDLVKAIRLKNMPEITLLLKRYLQEWLDRMGCGDQVLGAEPLALIITEHVLSQIAAGLPPDTPIPFDAFLKHRGIYFLAAATNLTEGRLEMLGEQQLVGNERALLLPGLLASSAFPGVFRPRWSWELRPATKAEHQYIDGGVMDNLPLDAVAQFLLNASKAGLIEPRPLLGGAPVPHLLFAASLEVSPAVLTPAEVESLDANWPALRKRAGVLRYNKKLEAYAEAQRAIRDMWATPGVARANARFVPLDLEVATVIPNWLCGTFAFHPMLGFRRAAQAESIAHGCATTLIALGRLVVEHPGWTRGWGIDKCQVPGKEYVERADPLVPIPAPRGRCWLRPDVYCPFSRERLAATGLAQGTVRELEQIHLACTRAKTHRRRG